MEQIFILITNCVLLYLINKLFNTKKKLSLTLAMNFSPVKKILSEVSLKKKGIKLNKCICISNKFKGLN